MSTLGGGNGGGWPPDGSGPSGGLPGFPPEWGVIVVPDTLAELGRETSRIRRELRREARRVYWRRWLQLSRRPVHRPDRGEHALGVPILVVSIAVVATLVGVIALAWPGDPTRTLLPDVTVTTPDGEPLRIREVLPAVILLVDGCACDTLVADAAALTTAQGHGVGVLAVGRNTAPARPPGDRVWVAADPTGTLRAAAADLSVGTVKASPGTATASVLLVDVGGRVRRHLPSVTSIEDFSTDLALLTLAGPAR